MRRVLLLPLLLVLACRSEPQLAEPAPAPRPERVLPPGEELNPYVLEILQEYPLDGSYAYHWPKSGGWEGTTQDVVYGERKLTSGDPQKRSYCCGLTFEVYVRALLLAGEGPLSSVDPERLHELRLRFFGDSREVRERRRLAQWGLESLGFGESITDLEQARAGDFVQFWRDSGSGHSAIFVNWIRKDGEIAGLTYWSTQSSTQGVGYNSERIGPQGVKRDEIYVGRAHWPLRPK